MIEAHARIEYRQDGKRAGRFRPWSPMSSTPGGEVFTYYVT